MLLEKKNSIRNQGLDYIRYQQFNWYGHVRRMMKKGYLKKCWNGVHLEEEEEEEEE